MFMQACINDILEAFRAPLNGFISRRVSDKRDAEEILQETLLKIYKEIDTLKDTEKIHAWIYQITRNTIIDYYRKNAKALQYDELREQMADEWNENLNFNEEIAVCLKSMLDSLPEIYRQAILLTEYDNLSQKELSERLGLSVSGAKSRVQRARQKLKKMLTGCCQFEFDAMGNIIEFQHKSKDCKYC